MFDQNSQESAIQKLEKKTSALLEKVEVLVCKPYTTVRLSIQRDMTTRFLPFLMLKFCQTTYSVLEEFPLRSYARICVTSHAMGSILNGSFISRSFSSSYRLCMELVLGSKVVINVT